MLTKEGEISKIKNYTTNDGTKIINEIVKSVSTPFNQVIQVYCKKIESAKDTEESDYYFKKVIEILKVFSKTINFGLFCATFYGTVKYCADAKKNIVNSISNWLYFLISMFLFFI